ncbi:hypothetical protein [Pseudomarimonas salicorniae]|uniref:Uncharacterized protein n=1 Tax=Pseudomarimonas salicorniae TaxID=2933270 RepID=A0ABT0GG50_9GAMM|nr:hypothetical protein [Lysobacter sp. CAU 1642]MCK7593515.1 hypothetical protein [Lysobacter sp. CAU 1642]
MSTLKEEATALEFDTEALRCWGIKWRVGTKQKEKSKVEPRTIAQLRAEGVAISSDIESEIEENKYPCAFNKKQGMDFGIDFDRAVGASLADMLGDIPVVDHAKLSAAKKVAAAAKKAATPSTSATVAAKSSKTTKKEEIEWTTNELLPPHHNCIEVGPARVIGGVRPQNFDVAYRPDGPRIVYDSKSLNDAESIPKNWQNMVNDLGTEATTIHTRFPYCIVAFIVAIPKPAIRDQQMFDMVRTLERLATRRDTDHPSHLAEAIALVFWDPDTGEVDSSHLDAKSNLHISTFMETIHARYVERYKGLPPHDKSTRPDESETTN